jgi:hypothetical protein
MWPMQPHNWGYQRLISLGRGVNWPDHFHLVLRSWEVGTYLYQRIVLIEVAALNCFIASHVGLLHSVRWSVVLEKSRSRNSSVNIALGHGLDGLDSIPGRSTWFLIHGIRTGYRVHPAPNPAKLEAVSPTVKRQRRELTTHFHLVSRSRLVELHLHFHGVMLN